MEGSPRQDRGVLTDTSPARVSELERALEYVRGLIEGRLPTLAKAEMPHTTATLRLALDRIGKVLDGS